MRSRGPTAAEMRAHRGIRITLKPTRGGRGKGGSPTDEHAYRSEVTKFRYAIDTRYLPVLVPFLLRPTRDGVTVTDEGVLVATLGLFKVSTPLANITGAHITRDYRWWTAVGVRMSRADDGLTFGTNRDAGVCIHFAEKVPSVLRRSGHSALTVTVADLEGLTGTLGGDREGPAPLPG